MALRAFTAACFPSLAVCSLSPKGTAHLQQPCKKDASKVAFYCMQALALLGKNHTTEERGEEFVLFFTSRKGMELAERGLDVAIAINRSKQ